MVKAERNKYLNFFQIEYGGPHQIELDKRLSFSLSLKIPISDNSKLKIRELQLEKQEVNWNQEADKIQKQKGFMALHTQIIQKIKAYYILNIYEKSALKTGENIEALINVTQFDPLEILEIKEELAKITLEKSIKKAEILSLYALFLEETRLIFYSDFAATLWSAM